MEEINERNIFKYVLFDFMRELPSTFDRDQTTVAEAFEIIDAFIREHGLDDE